VTVVQQPKKVYYEIIGDFYLYAVLHAKNIEKFKLIRI
jgi:hypothetical protein